MAGRSDMAIVRSFRDDRRRQVAVREEEGLRRDPATYPDLTKVRQEPASEVWRVDERHVLGVAAVGRTSQTPPRTPHPYPASAFRGATSTASTDLKSGPTTLGQRT
jgi:hypothetical protein